MLRATSTPGAFANHRSRIKPALAVRVVWHRITLALDAGGGETRKAAAFSRRASNGERELPSRRLGALGAAIARAEIARGGHTFAQVMIELDGVDLCRLPIEYRKHKLAKLLRSPHPGIVLNEHYEGDGDIVFEHACKLGCEGIVSKRLGSSYRSGRRRR